MKAFIRLFLIILFLVFLINIILSPNIVQAYTGCYTIGDGINQERLKVVQVRREDPNTNDLYCKIHGLEDVCYIADRYDNSNVDDRVYLSFEFPFSLEEIELNSGELFFRFQGDSYYEDDGYVDISSCDSFNPYTVNWNIKPGHIDDLGTSPEVNSGYWASITFTDTNLIKTGFSGNSAYYYLKGNYGEGGTDGQVQIKFTQNNTYLNICYFQPDCASGECCDISSGTFKPDGTICGPIENPVCDIMDVGGCSGHAVQDQCTGTSETCPNNNMILDYPQACYEMDCGGCGICTDEGTCNLTEGISCSSDNECDDFNPYTQDICINPGTCDSYCESSNYCGNSRCDNDEDELNCTVDCKAEDTIQYDNYTEYSLLYDSVGNLLEDINYIYEYDEFNQLKKVKDKDNNVLAEYSYNYEGNRIKKIDYNSGGSNTTTYYPDPNFVRVIDSSGAHDTIFYYDGITLVGRKDESGTYFYHPDHLGSTNVVTDLVGNVVERTDYLPFGAVLEGGQSRYLFTGKEKDSTDLMYYGARYYDPFTRHFTQADTVLPDVYDPLQLNRYAYARNNPVMHTDPTGHCAGFCLAAYAIGAWAIGGGTVFGGIDLIHQIGWGGKSMFGGTADWSSAGKSFTVGAAAGSTGYATGALVAPIYSGTTGLAALAGYTSTGAAAGMTSLAAGQATSNVLYGQPMTSNLFEAAASGATWGGVFGLGAGMISQVAPLIGIGGRSVSQSTTRLGTSSLTNKGTPQMKSVAQLGDDLDVKILPFKQGMKFGTGKLHGSKNTAVIHENYGGFNMDYHYHPSIYAPGKMRLTVKGYDKNPIQQVIFDDLTKGGVNK